MITRALLLPLLTAVVSSAAVCSRDTARASDITRVQRDVATVARATYDGDVETIVKYTHPAIIQAMGGWDSARVVLAEVIRQPVQAGFKLESFTFPRAPEFLEGGGRRFAVIPTLSIVSAKGQKMESLNFQLGVLEPGSPQWVYVEGSRINKENVQVLFPGFPADYKFPAFYRKRL